MDTNKKSFFRHFNIYNFKYGTKLFLVFLILLTMSLFFAYKVGDHYLKKYIIASNYEKLAHITDLKKNYLENKVAIFKRDFANLGNEEFKYKTKDLITAFNNEGAFVENGSAIYSPDSAKAYTPLLKDYYESDILENISWNTPVLADIFPKYDNAIIYQYQYIYLNPNPKEDKDRFSGRNDNSSYSRAHNALHTQIRRFARKNHINNMYLISANKGNIIYNLNKNISFGTNIFYGPYKHTHLANAFHKALTTNGDALVFTDYDYFIPNDNKAVGFITYTLREQDKRIAVLIAEIDPEFYQNILLEDWMMHSDESISLNLIGKDHQLRTNDIEQIKKPEEFFGLMADKGRKNEKFRAVASLKSSAFVLGFDEPLALHKPTSTLAKNYLGEKTFLYSQPVKIGNLNYSLVGQSNSDKSFYFLGLTRWVLLGLFAILILVAAFITYLVKNSLTKRLAKLDNSIRTTTKGEKSDKIENKWKDELGNTISEFDLLKERINDASKFAFLLSEENYEAEFKSESENDNFGQALNTLKEKLKTNKAESEERERLDKIQGWINDGIANFNDLLRQSNDNINQLAYLVIEHLIEYLDAVQGGVFLIEGEEDAHKEIILAASYAYDRRKFHTKSIEIGEGLIGNCYLEKKPIHLNNIPEDYIEITSGLGKTTPKSLYIVPLMMDNVILGIMEIASLNTLEEYKIDFINKLADNIAATFSTVKLNTKTAILLEESKRRANEIAQQEEEMRQNMEEMQATQEELARIRDEDEKKTNDLTREIDGAHKLIQQLLNSMDGEVLLKDSHGIVILANEEAGRRFNSTPDKLRGKSDDELFSPEKAEREQVIDQLVLKEGFYSDETIELVGTEDVKYFIVKKQFFLPIRKEPGILTIRNKRQ